MMWGHGDIVQGGVGSWGYSAGWRGVMGDIVWSDVGIWGYSVG